MSHAHSPGHSHGGEVSWRPARRIRILLLAALAPFAIATVAGLVVLWPTHHKIATPLQYQTYGEGKTVFEKGKVVEVVSRTCGGSGNGTLIGQPSSANQATICTTSTVLISSGPDTGKRITLVNGGLADVKLHVNDQIRVVRGPIADPRTGARAYTFDDYQRDAPLILLAAIFAVVLVVVARWRGLAALFGLAVAYGVLVYFLLPALVDGRSPVAVGIIGGAAILFVVLYVAHGFSSRTTTALLGTLVALLFTSGFAAIATSATKLTGRSNEINAEISASGIPVSISGLILCGMIVGALGVINDITVTQASSVWELSYADPKASWRTLFTQGMRIGRDHIASVVYTIVFAYTGAALPVLLLFSISGRSLHDLITGDEIGGEIVRNVVAGTGLMLAVPFTTLIAALVAARPHEAQEAHEQLAQTTGPSENDPGLDALEARIAASSLQPKPPEPPGQTPV